MLKQDAIRMLGGTPASAAKLIGVTPSAISLWPDELPPRITDRVQAALWRMSQPAAPTDPQTAVAGA